MRPAPERLCRFWLASVGLTLASALAAHFVFDVVEGGFERLISHPIHLLYVLIVAAVFASAAREIGAARRMRPSPCRTRPVLLVANIVAQLVLTWSTLALEGMSFQGVRVAVATLAAIFAVILGALTLGRLEAGLVRIVLARYVPRDRRRIVVAVDPRLAFASTGERVHDLFRPKRAPPPLLA